MMRSIKLLFSVEESIPILKKMKLNFGIESRNSGLIEGKRQKFTGTFSKILCLPTVPSSDTYSQLFVINPN